MAKKVSKYSACNLCFMLFAALCVLSLCLPVVSGVAESVPTHYFNISGGKLFVVFGIMFIVLKALPAILTFVVQLLPVEIIKKYVITFCTGVFAVFGEIVCYLIISQRFQGSVGSGFIIGFLASILITVCTILFTKTNGATKKHKDLVWYKGFNRIFLILGVPVSAGMTVGIILFYSLVFSFSIPLLLGTICIWASLVTASIVAVCSLYGKDRFGLLYYLISFLSVSGTVLFCWSDSLTMLIFGFVAAVLLGAFWLSMANVAKKYF